MYKFTNQLQIYRYTNLQIKRICIFVHQNTMPKTILIVEDETSLANILEEKFREEGFDVLVAKNGIEGLNHARKKKPDLILLDIIMPHMDGFSMLRELRSNGDRQDIPVILLTNLGDANYITEAVDEGASGYLIKTDWSLDDIVAKVKKRLKLYGDFKKVLKNKTK